MAEKLADKKTYAEALKQFKEERELPAHAAGEVIKPSVEQSNEASVEKTQAAEVAEAHKAVNEAEPVAALKTEALAEHEQAENESDLTVSPTVSRQAIKATGKRTLKNVQKREKLPARSFSRLVHLPLVRGVSELSSKTVSRPSALLGGGLAALLGSGSYLILAKYIGFSYNYTISLALFAGGFVFGLVLELLVHLATASRRQIN